MLPRTKNCSRETASEDETGQAHCVKNIVQCAWRMILRAVMRAREVVGLAAL